MKIRISILEDQMDAFKKEYFKLNDIDAIEMEPIIDPYDRRRVIFSMDYDRFKKISNFVPGCRSLGMISD